MRVGRFGDPCYRICDSAIKLIDEDQSIIIKGKIAATIERVEKKVKKQSRN